MKLGKLRFLCARRRRNAGEPDCHYEYPKSDFGAVFGQSFRHVWEEAILALLPVEYLSLPVSPRLYEQACPEANYLLTSDLVRQEVLCSLIPGTWFSLRH